MGNVKYILLIRALGPTYGTYSLPYGIIAIANYIHSHSEYRAIIVDRYKEFWRGINYITGIIKARDVRIVGISAMSSQRDDAVYMARHIKNDIPGVKVILGGIHFTAMPEDGLKHADAVVKGEGEKIFLSMTDAFFRNNADIKGIYRGESLVDLDEAGYPTREVLKKVLIKSGRGFLLMSSRGCPYECKFCLSRAIRDARMRYHSIESMFDYVELLAADFRIRNIFFTDDIFILRKDRILKFYDEFNKRGLSRYNIEFACFTHAGHGDMEVYSKLREIGFKSMAIGVEFGDDRILEINGKRQKTADVERTIRLITAAGIKLRCLFMIGGMGEDSSTIQKTISLAERLRKEHRCLVSFSLAQPLPGSEFFQEAEKYGRMIGKNCFQYSTRKISFLPEGMSKQELMGLYLKARLLDKKNIVRYFAESFHWHYFRRLFMDTVAGLYYKSAVAGRIEDSGR